MALPIRMGNQQQSTSILEQFKQELPGLMLRYVFDRLARNQASELQKDRMNYEMNLNVVSDYITDLNSQKRDVESDLKDTKESIQGSLSALKAHSAETVKLDEYSTTAGSSSIPDYIMNNLILSAENKEIIGQKASRVEQLSSELEFYKGQKQDLITVNAALDRIESVMEKKQVDPSLVGEGMMGYVTDEHDMQAYWDANFATIFEGDPYKDVIKDVFFQQTPTSTDQKGQVADYIRETKTLREIDENEFLDTAKNSLASIQTSGQLQWQGFHDPEDTVYDLNDSQYDDLRSEIKRQIGFVTSNDDANKYILNSLRNMSLYTDPFSFYVDVLDEQRASIIQTRIAEQFFPVPVREMKSAHDKYSGQYASLFQILQSGRQSQAIDSNVYEDAKDIDQLGDELINMFK